MLASDDGPGVGTFFSSLVLKFGLTSLEILANLGIFLNNSGK